MGALFDDSPAIHDDDPVGGPGGRQPVRDDDRGAGLISRSSASWTSFSLCASSAEVASSSSRKRRVAKQGAGDDDALALTARQPRPAFAEETVIAVRRSG